MKPTRFASTCLIAMTWFGGFATSWGSDHGRFLYIQSNSILEGQNSVIAYQRLASGKLNPLPGSPFLTGRDGHEQQHPWQGWGRMTTIRRLC